jgi:hypothetical protein
MRWLQELRAYLAGLANETHQVREAPGPLTAREAWDLAAPVARARDPGARLAGITSGLDLSPEGRSYTWEFFLDLPRFGRRALFTVAPDGPDLEGAGVALRCRYLEGGEPRRAIPEAFMDSPDAVRVLAEAGVDFVAGPTDMKLETEWDVTQGEGPRAVWVTEDFSGRRSTPLG